MPAAVIAAGIGAAGAVGGAAIASSGSRSAARSAQQSADQATQLQAQTRDMNMAALAPWQRSGLAANNAINALLGIAEPAPMAGMPQPNALSQFRGMDGYTGPMQMGMDMGIQDFGAFQGNVPANAPTGPSALDQQRAAFDQFRNSTGYQFRLNEGMNAINSGYAGRGAIKSGAAMRAINDYGQGMASAEFGNYMGLLQNQANAGLSAVNAQAGVATNAANNMGNIAMQNGANQANAALLRAQNNGQLVNSLATIGGNLAGQLINRPTVAAPMAGNGGQIVVTRGMF